MIRYFNELIGDQEPDANTCNTDVNTGTKYLYEMIIIKRVYKGRGPNSQ